MKAWRWIESIVILLPVRLLLAAVFGYAAVLKLADPQAFGFAIKGFKIFDPQAHEHLLIMMAYGIPWAELLTALLLLVGFWTRGAAALLSVMTLGFMAGQMSLISRGIDTNCACFGDRDFLCEGPVGWCHVGRNAVLLVASLVLLWRGGGLLAVDAARREHPRADGRVDADGDGA